MNEAVRGRNTDSSQKGPCQPKDRKWKSVTCRLRNLKSIQVECQPALGKSTIMRVPGNDPESSIHIELFSVYFRREKSDYFKKCLNMKHFDVNGSIFIDLEKSLSFFFLAFCSHFSQIFSELIVYVRHYDMR
jgi:hypothetical protein